MGVHKQPSKNKTSVWHLYNVGPTSKTLGQHCTNVIQMLCVCWVNTPIALSLECCINESSPRKVRYSWGRWPDGLAVSRLAAGKMHKCWKTVFDAEPTLKQHWFNVWASTEHHWSINALRIKPWKYHIASWPNIRPTYRLQNQDRGLTMVNDWLNRWASFALTWGCNLVLMGGPHCLTRNSPLPSTIHPKQQNLSGRYYNANRYNRSIFHSIHTHLTNTICQPIMSAESLAIAWDAGPAFSYLEYVYRAISTVTYPLSGDGVWKKDQEKSIFISANALDVMVQKDEQMTRLE